jgi:hypothetical protein
MIRMFIPDPDLEFLPIPDPGVQKAPDPDQQHCFWSNLDSVCIWGDVHYGVSLYVAFRCNVQKFLIENRCCLKAIVFSLDFSTFMSLSRSVFNPIPS